MPALTLESEGEEFECAKAIDRLGAVQQWVRNVLGTSGARRVAGGPCLS